MASCPASRHFLYINSVSSNSASSVPTRRHVRVRSLLLVRAVAVREKRQVFRRLHEPPLPERLHRRRPVQVVYPVHQVYELPAARPSRELDVHLLRRLVQLKVHLAVRAPARHEIPHAPRGVLRGAYPPPHVGVSSPEERARAQVRARGLAAHDEHERPAAVVVGVAKPSLAVLLHPLRHRLAVVQRRGVRMLRGLAIVRDDDHDPELVRHRL
eukprot:14810-Pelagococcus_subviridis.AAC.7